MTDPTPEVAPPLPEALPTVDRRTRLWQILRLLLLPLALAALVGWLVQDAGDDLAPTAWDRVPIALGMLQLLLAAQSLRLFLVLRGFGIAIAWRDCPRIHWQSSFYLVVVPMQVGMEIARFLKVRGCVPGVDRATLLLALLVDRAFGLAAACLLLLAALPAVSLDPEFGITLDWRLPAAALGLGLVVVAAVFAVGRLRRRILDALARTWRATRGRRWRLVAGFGVSLVAMALWVESVRQLGTAVGVPLDPAVAVFGVLGAVLGSLVPVSFAGAGPGDAIAVTAFVLAGVMHAGAVVLALCGWGLRVLAAIEGGVWEWIESARGLRR